MATHSSILAWRIPWTEEPGGLQSMGSQRVIHDWVTWQQHSLLLLFPLILFTKKHYVFHIAYHSYSSPLLPTLIHLFFHLRNIRGYTTPVFLPREFHGQRSLAGYSPWGHKELDTTEQLHSLTHSCRLAGTETWGLARHLSHLSLI